ncbi:aspartate aminotransferase family protein [Candidatus Planktophila dulcis]|uniref:aspartate aminotransferase family protein n=1 Tax=Candidatus Planktophila dulcis TaxID=1884914 RepID=UPI003CF0CD93
MTQPPADPARGKEVFDLDRSYVFHSWSAQAQISPLPVAGGEGSYFWDYDGNKYLDFSSQLVFTNIGHQHPKVIKAIQEQAGLYTTVAPQHANEARGEAAKRITARAGAHHNKVFFTNGGADGVENAIRLARIHTHRHKILSFYRSYHGNTTAAIASTGDPRRWPNEYAYGHIHFFGPYLYRSAFWAKSEEEECKRALEHLEQVIIFEGATTIAAILIESVVGTAGVLVPPVGYLEGVRALCDKYGIKWIADEVMSGFGRTGKWFAYQHSAAEPDLIVFAKGVNSGYVPLGGVIISDEIAATFNDRVFPGGLTYSGHPLATAAAVATLDVMTDEKIVENAALMGEKVIKPLLEDLMAKHKVIGEIRGKGVFWALDLVTDRATRAPLAPYGATSPAMNELVAACKKLGLFPFNNYNRMHICPPCNITEAELREGFAILDQAFASIAHHYTGA